MHSTSLRKVGGSIMLAVPPPLLDLLELRAGARVALDVRDGHLVVEPCSRPRYSLDELLAQCDETAEDDPAPDWVNGGAVGKELI